jgi:hypothetical protein
MYIFKQRSRKGKDQDPCSSIKAELFFFPVKKTSRTSSSHLKSMALGFNTIFSTEAVSLSCIFQEAQSCSETTAEATNPNA